MRTSDQSALFHCWCREISVHCKKAKVKNISEDTIKELVLLTLGNTIEVFGTKVAIRSRFYKRADEDLTEKELQLGIISMNDLLTKIQVWASVDLSLELKTPNEEVAA